jgi:hypothetical protein
MPEWPQQNKDFTPRPIEHAPNTFRVSGPNRRFLNDSWDLSKGALWDMGVWENWDLVLGDLHSTSSRFSGFGIA